MAENETVHIPVQSSAEGTDSTDEGGLGDYPLYSDPFDFSDDKPESPLDKIEFNLDGDTGELVVSGLDGEIDDESVKEEGEEKQVLTAEDPNYVADPFKDKPEELKTIEKENAELKERLARLEGRFVDSDSQKKQAELVAQRKEKLEAAGFTDEQIEVILEINPIKVEEDKPTEEKSIEDKKSQEEIALEAGQVLRHYDGKEGRPSVDEMKDHVEYTYMKFGDRIKDVPLPTLFRMAENALFIRWLDNNYPNEMKKFTYNEDGTPDIQKTFKVGENLRKAYYTGKGKPISSYDHLRLSKKSSEKSSSNGTEPKPNNVNNEDVIRLANEKNENSRNVPGGEIETEEELKARKKPRSARSTVEATVNSFFGEGV